MTNIQKFRKGRKAMICARCNAKFSPKRYSQIYCTANCQAQVWREENPEKVKEAEKKYRESNPEKVKLKMRKQALKRKYGMTMEDYEQMLKSQNGKCSICNEEKQETLCVDHDHNTGKVRGLLCRHCNHVVGFAKDNIDILNNVINYLRKGE